MAKPNFAKPSFRETVAEEMIRRIELGTAPWQKPWQPGMFRSAPFNPTSDKDYRGINSWWLEMQSRSDPRWMTFKQARAAGAQVRKGEKGTQVEYWKWTDRSPALDDAGKPVLDDRGKPRTQEVRLDRPKVFYAVVFNGEQIDGLEPYVVPAPDWKPEEKAEKLLEQGGIPIHHDQSDRAFYRPSTDKIHTPPKAAFKESYEYYSTALHELGHGTGNEKRLARDFGPFGSDSYAREELRAEMASFMIATETGLGHYPDRHAAYVESWLKALKNDRNQLFQAARDAETIRAWIMEPDKRLALEQSAQKRLGAEKTVEKVMDDKEEKKPLWRRAIDAGKRLYEGKDTAMEPEAFEIRAREIERLYNEDSARLAREYPKEYGEILESNGGKEHHARLYLTFKKGEAEDLAKDGILAWDPAQKSYYIGGIGKDFDRTVLEYAGVDQVSLFIREQQPDYPGKPEFATDQFAAGIRNLLRQAMQREYLSIPYKDKDEVKALGAKWDRTKKSWFVPEDGYLAPFDKWTQRGHVPEPKISPIEEFADACRAQGLSLKGNPTMDGKWHRIAVEGDGKGQMSGSYRGFLDGRPAGQIMNYKNGQEAIKWVATGNKMEPEELERLKAEAAQRNAQRQAEIKAQHKATAKRAYGIYENAKPAPADHPYLAQKQVPVGELRIDDKGTLLVPMRTPKGYLMNVQTIQPDGTKRFLKEGKKSGLLHMIQGDKSGPIIVAEGYATAASLHAATGRTVAVAFDAGNLEPVAKALKKAEPDRPLLIAADDDHAKKKNAGIDAAKAAALAVGGTALVPNLTADEKAKGLTDFNDLARARGTKALEAIVSSALAPEQRQKKARKAPAREMEAVL